MDEFFQYLSSLHPLSDELKGALVGRIHKETFRKHRTILSTGHFCDWIAFIEKGMVRVCYDIPGGDERIISFVRAGEVACAVKSFTANVASRVSIVSMDETVVRKIRKIELEAICEKHPAFNIHVRKIIEGQSFLLEDHYLLLTLPARDRLKHLGSELAWMLGDRRIKNYMVADYLGVDKATYSRWRNGK
jgi:CRP-like cAMP-binding protein